MHRQSYSEDRKIERNLEGAHCGRRSDSGCSGRTKPPQPLSRWQESRIFWRLGTPCIPGPTGSRRDLLRPGNGSGALAASRRILGAAGAGWRQFAAGPLYAPARATRLDELAIRTVEYEGSKCRSFIVDGLPLQHVDVALAVHLKYEESENMTVVEQAAASDSRFVHASAWQSRYFLAP
ncbi:hypothetical protein VTK26DRAFT_7472 [Humicola hyalothermophila]